MEGWFTALSLEATMLVEQTNVLMYTKASTGIDVWPVEATTKSGSVIIINDCIYGV